MQDHVSKGSKVEVKVRPPAPKKASPLKKYFLYVLVGGLVVSALISIVSILAGEFNDLSGKALLTTVSIVFHSLLGLLFLSADRSDRRDTTLLVNTIFGIVIASLATTVLSIWDIIDGPVVGDLYLTYFLAIVACLVIAGLLNATMVDRTVKALSWSSIVSVLALFLLLLPWVFADNNYELVDFYYRSVAALSILSSTLIVLTVIFDRLYRIKHPKPKPASDGASVAVRVTFIVIAAVVGLPIVLSMLFGFLAFLLR